MKLVAPDYYKDFVCIADRCNHSCCIGWEIDIDEESLGRFETLKGDYGPILRSRIDYEGEVPHFRLGEGERCPFLQENGLCEMILTIGEDSLCQICTDHPRYRNYFADHTEIGLGLCCEAAGELILGRTVPIQLTVLEDDGVHDETDEEEESLLSFRDMLFDILSDRTCTLEERVEELLATCGTALPEGGVSEWAKFLLTLERLDEGWTEKLTALTEDCPLPIGTPWDIPLEQAGIYFLYRHLPAALDDGDVASKAAFAALSVKLLWSLFVGEGCNSLYELVELARMYSSEIEYSEENLQAVFDWLAE